MVVPRHVTRRCAAVLVAVLALGAAAGSASAHVQVRPAVVAPEDPVLWTVLVPNETEASTTRVELKIPAGVTPFSWVDVPGWRRTEELAANGALDTVTWTGRLAGDGLAEFRFLATSPAKAGPITWKALQTYSDGSVVRWIGDPGSEEPASVTRVVAGAPRENAGGEGRTAAPASSTRVPAAADDGGDEPDDLGRLLGAGGLVLGAAALGVAVAGRRRG